MGKNNGKAAPESAAKVEMTGWIHSNPIVSEDDKSKNVTRVAFMLQTSRKLDNDKTANLLTSVKVFGELADEVSQMNLEKGAGVCITGYLNNERMTRGSGKDRAEVKTADGKPVYEHYVSLDDSFGSVSEVDLGDQPDLSAKKDDKKAAGKGGGRSAGRAAR